MQENGKSAWCTKLFNVNEVSKNIVDNQTENIKHDTEPMTMLFYMYYFW